MSNEGRTPHDALVADTFSDPNHARAMLEGLLPAKIVDHLDMATLEMTREHLVDERLRKVEVDLLYRVKLKDGREAFIYILLEHQSTYDKHMPWRLLKYVVRIWDGWERKHEGWERLPPVVPVVLSHVPGGWRGESELLELIDGPEELLQVLAPYLPSFRPVLVDLSTIPDEALEQLRGSALTRLVLLLVKHIRDGDVQERLPQWGATFVEVLQGSGMEALLRVLKYIVDCVEDLEPEGLEWLEQEPEIPATEVLMTLGERLREEGRKEGRKEGLEKGRSLLRKQLRLRFGALPSWAEARLGRVGLDELEELGERVLTAKTLEEVLAPKR